MVVDLTHLNYLSYENRTKQPAPILSFALFIGLQLIVVLVCIRYSFPSTWNQHVSSGIWAILFTCLICNLVICFGEYFFHRYLLHLETVRFLRYMTTSHLTHHKLTSIWFDDATKRTHSKYPICNVAQDDQATFPPWALIPTFAAFTPFFAPIAFSFPEIPILISGYTALAIALFLYETLHVMHHQPYETWWKTKTEQSNSRKTVAQGVRVSSRSSRELSVQPKRGGILWYPSRRSHVRHVQTADHCPFRWHSSHERSCP